MRSDIDMRVCQPARAAAARARALPRDARVTWHLSRRGRRAITFWQVAATPLFAANAKRTASLGASSRASRCPNKRRRRWPALRDLRPEAYWSVLHRSECNGALTKGLRRQRYLINAVSRGAVKSARHGARGRRPSARDIRVRATVRSGDVWRNLPISRHRRLEAAETQPPTRPMRGPDMNQNKKKLELCRLSTAEVSAFHSGLFSHHCR